jgi:hypothetical protein
MRDENPYRCSGYTILEELILADLKHSQLVFGLTALHLDPTDFHFLEIHDLEARLIGVCTDPERNRFTEIYIDYMQQSTQFSVSFRGEELKQ